MVGMLQIITYLLAVYLVMKGIEIFQIAFMSSREKGRKVGLAIGGVCIAASLVAAYGFTYMQDLQAASTGRNAD